MTSRYKYSRLDGHDRLDEFYKKNITHITVIENALRQIPISVQKEILTFVLGARIAETIVSENSFNNYDLVARFLAEVVGHSEDVLRNA